MRRVTVNIVIAFALAMLAGQAVPAGQAGGVAVNVTGGVAGSVLDIALNGGKVGQVTADSQGMASTAIDVSFAGEVRVQVYVERCQDGRNVLILLTPGKTMPKDEKCDRKLIGAFWANKARRITVDLAAGTLDVQNAGMSTALKIGLAAGGAAAVGIGVAAGGGSNSSTGSTAVTTTTTDTSTSSGSSGSSGSSSTFDPNGTYNSTTTVKDDPAGHAQYIQLASMLQLTVAVSGSTMTTSGPSGSNWVTVSGPYDSSNGSFNLTGQGTVAGYQNIAVQFQGTLSSSGQLMGDYTMGTGGHLPQGKSATYGVSGQKN